jgi:DnaJ-class molecular chaperone
MKERDYIPEQVGRSMYNSLKILGLGLGASEQEVKLAYQRLASIFHLDKWEHSRHTTGMTLPETTAHFQMLNNTQSFYSHDYELHHAIMMHFLQRRYF